ncbi:TetR/AcrR family transcriptional regulator [Microbacterium fluvii]|uniref:TetR/AcrR family transcriptional regulator n=1 Tax=Microbacterium fluvii TaxID=415215 RepID=A0ABW2HG13_9MICO|nr:TetR/AcrR family transcriptional regulator [Microbacterium fluvii]MCU4673159.1 TetR/AcrR family transcriptional regulator [Microbacterium fluvii]
MGRPSVAAERRTQIIEATLRCLETRGFAGTTLDRIAEEAGMARGHVRHFAGNRDDLLVDAARTFYFGFGDEIPAEPSILPEGTASVGDALAYLFDGFAEQTPDNAVALALIEAARSVEPIRPILVAAYVGTQSALERLLASAAPAAAPALRAQVAYGILSLALGNVFMGDVEVSAERTALARAAADHLIASLRS